MKKQLEEVSRNFLKRISDLEPSASAVSCLTQPITIPLWLRIQVGNWPREGKARKVGLVRQVGVALLVSRDKRIPLYYREYEGNRHDSKVFLQIMDDMFMAMRDAAGARGTLPLFFDKGMNS